MHNFKSFLLILVTAVGTGMVNAQNVQELPSLIPLPASVAQEQGRFSVSNKTVIYCSGNAEVRALAEMLSAELKSRTGGSYSIRVTDNAVANNAILLVLNKTVDTLGDEGYRLRVDGKSVVMSANTPQGLFYALQTLLQLIPVEGKTDIPAVAIVDKPRFGWRGLMLDTGRYFYSIDFLKKFLDYMAMHKLNTFHWHLTEDHGWRLQIKKHPKLTDVGAWRAGTQYGKAPHQIDKNPHGGFYTQEQVKELIAYAAKRYITIVPEIEMPGHSLSVLAAYPQLSCTGGPFEMPVNWGIQKDVFCAGNEQSFQLLEDVLTEVAELFPSPIIHIGGDECPKDRWKACTKCQQRIKKENLKDEHELQSYFIKRIEKFLQTKNKRIIGWDEILEGGLAPNASVMSWRGINGGIAAAREHHDVIMTPTDFLYFDYYQGEHHLEPVAIGGLVTLEKVYSYEPVPAELTAAEVPFIKGVQGNVWAEHIHSPEKVEYMTYPRAAALAEIAWTPAAKKNWTEFTRRMNDQYKRYEKAGLNYSPSALNVVIIDQNQSDSTALLSFSTNAYKPEIRYTTDGSEPSAKSPVYDSPVELGLPVTVKAAVFENGVRKGRISSRSVLRRPGPYTRN